MKTHGDLTGKRFERLIVVSKSSQKKSYGQNLWHCLCDCGNKTLVETRQLTDKRTRSCGCIGKEKLLKRNANNKYGLMHGLSNHPLRAIRKAMLQRCYNEKNPYFYTYGARGITVCEEWRESLENFISWSIESGWKKGLSIDRKDANAHYTPQNCHWITIQENSRKNMLKLWRERWNKKLKYPIDSYPGLTN